MLEIIHESGAPNNALSMKTVEFRHIQKLWIQFFHPKYTVLNDKDNPDPVGSLQLDIDSAIELRDLLTHSIDNLMAAKIKDLKEGLEKARDKKGTELKKHCDVFLAT